MAKPILTQEYLKECLHYDPETGIFTWLRRPREHFKANHAWLKQAKRVGKECGHLETQKQYRFISINTFAYGAHRLAFLYMSGAMPEMIDHINHNRGDNRWANLRAATHSENQRNQNRSKANTSGCTGVTFDKSRGKWLVNMCADGRYRTIGRFKNFDDAVAARKNAEKQNGFHENHGLCQ